jgi:hypothetical protein
VGFSFFSFPISLEESIQNTWLNCTKTAAFGSEIVAEVACDLRWRFGSVVM